MTINLTPEQEKIVKEELESGHFRTAEELISQALRALRATVPSSGGGVDNGSRREADRKYSLSVLSSLSEKQAVVPLLWFYEVGNGLLMAYRRKRICTGSDRWIPDEVEESADSSRPASAHGCS